MASFTRPDWQEPHKRKSKLIVIPGLSYIPDKLELAEKPSLVYKLETEFTDFLKCVTEVLGLLQLLKARHLASTFPIPHDVLRELQRGKGPLFKAYDKIQRDPIAGISHSGHNFKKTAAAVAKYKQVGSSRKSGKRPLEADLVEITGKRTKPLWHVVAAELPPDPLLDPEASEAILREKDPPYPPLTFLTKKHLPMDRTRSDEIISAIQYVGMTPVKPSTDTFQNQVDMMSAYGAGFQDVQKYKAYLETLKPHWFKDLVSDAREVGILTCTEVLQGLEAVGKFYDLDSLLIPNAKAKICYIVMSLPIWDICRMSMQMAITFILEKILKLPESQQSLEDWLTARKLPCVVFTPLHSEEFDMTDRVLEKTEHKPKERKQPGFLSVLKDTKKLPNLKL